MKYIKQFLSKRCYNTFHAWSSILHKSFIYLCLTLIKSVGYKIIAYFSRVYINLYKFLEPKCYLMCFYCFYLTESRHMLYNFFIFFLSWHKRLKIRISVIKDRLMTFSLKYTDKAIEIWKQKCLKYAMANMFSDKWEDRTP